MRLSSHLKRLARLASTPIRRWPEFMIIGAQKSATTSLYDFLCKHPMVTPAQVKEIHYFDYRYHMGDTWYKSHYPIRKRNILSGEATPDILWATPSMSKINQLLPGLKVLVVLREPAERAISHYYHNVRKGREHRSLSQALFDPMSFVAAKEVQFGTSKYYDARHFSYIARSRYAEQLQEVDRVFGLDKTLTLRFSDVTNLNTDTRARIFNFLNLDDYEIDGMSTKNPGIPKKSKEVESISLELDRHLSSSRLATLDLLGWDKF